MICTVILANAVVAIVKIPFGRMRYRAMNTAGGASIGGFANFTRWYVRNGQMDKAQMMTLSARQTRASLSRAVTPAPRE